jgi:3-oxoacyl-[acyl-carrier protein] reductase
MSRMEKSPVESTRRVALVTGAAGAIGGATARRLAQDGFVLALADLQPGPQDLPGADWHTLDVRSTQQVRSVVEAVLQSHGRIDVLVNVAGITSFGSAQDLPQQEWERVLDINLSGTFRCCQAVMASMKAQRSGRIVNLGSVLGKNGGNTRPWIDPAEQRGSGNVAYGVSKAGVHAMTAYLARELASSGVTVNAVAPGPVASAMTSDLPPAIRSLIPVGRMGRPEDVAAVVGFLASAQAAFITGEVIDVNGGMWCD